MSISVPMPPVSKFAEVGQPIPDTAHAVSVSLPSWKANVGYEEGEEWVVSRMKNGYPRFFIHLSIRSFAEAIVSEYGQGKEQAMLFPTTQIAVHCMKFIQSNCLVSSDTTHLEKDGSLRILDLVLHHPYALRNDDQDAITVIAAVLMPRSCFSVATKFWQHSGEGISSRRAEMLQRAFTEGHLKPREGIDNASGGSEVNLKGPRRYQTKASRDVVTQIGYDHNKKFSALKAVDPIQFVEERFGRNLDPSLTKSAKFAIRRRIAGSLTANVAPEEALSMPVSVPAEGDDCRIVSVDDVYLYPTGMSSIFNTHKSLMSARGSLKSIMFGFPYIDTLKILEKFGPGCIFYGEGSSADLDDLERRCENGDKFLALFCEFPGNPLLKTPDLSRIRGLADRYDFAVVIDETIGNFLNVHILPVADIVVSSLTKVFSGDSNVMGGSCILNPRCKYYERLREVLTSEYKDNFWSEDAICLERNSRDFVSRNERINKNAELLCTLLKNSTHVKQVFYPKFSPSRKLFDVYRTAHGGYGGLFSITFHETAEAVAFFDALRTAKGPSLGTNFTLSCPFVLLAHYNELDWAAQFGAEADLVRVSVGLEEPGQLSVIFQNALNAIDLLKAVKNGCQ